MGKSFFFADSYIVCYLELILSFCAVVVSDGCYRRLSSGRGPKEALRGNGRKLIGELRTENNKIVTNNEDILNVCAKFYQDLYSPNSDQSSAIGPHTQNNEKIPLFVEDEIRNALKSMKANKAPGNDQIASDVIKLGGTQVIKQLKIIFNNILKSKTIPKEWKEAKIKSFIKRRQERYKKLPPHKSSLPHL